MKDTDDLMASQDYIDTKNGRDRVNEIENQL